MFAKGNAPFKSKIQELIDTTLVFRWDLLHMINRCHIDAKKGEVVIDSLEDADEVGLDDDHIQKLGIFHIPELSALAWNKLILILHL